MPVFSYVARNAAGRRQEGEQEAPSASALVQTLRQRGWLVLQVSAADTGVLSIDVNPLNWLPPRSLDIEVSLHQMSVLLRSGLTLLTALKTIAEYASRHRMRRVWEQVAEKIQQGSSLADAMTSHRCFPNLIVQLVRVGEQTGNLEQVVTRGAEGLERRRLLRTQFLTAMAYPAIVLIAAIGVTAFMILYLIPKLKKFLEVLGRKLPPMTQNLIDVSDFFVNYGPQILAGMVALTFAAIAIYRWPPGRLFVDRIALRIWVIGYILRLAVTVQFAHGLSLLLGSGITLVEGLRTVEQLLSNRFVAGRVGSAREAVLKGGSLAEPLAVPGAFLPMLARMVAVGESAGTLDEVLAEVARFHEKQLQAAIRQLSTLIEPAITVVVGSIVGYVYIAFFVAMFAAAGGPPR